ncbi:MAG: class I SAM-dependent methyltransferase [Anaerolineales bacterium]|nr:class I SAM-dependent methyltransferase [Anaerolineales bacterium]
MEDRQNSPDSPPVCDYEGSDYQTRFWDQGGRAYEDGAEAAALKRLLPPGGKTMLEIGAGAGRNTLRYKRFETIVLMDYSLTQMQQAQARLGRGEKYVYVAADVYRLPFTSGYFEAATMIRVLHHMAEPELALKQIRQALQPGATFILEFANKQNLKAILRYLFNQQAWSPYTLEPVEYIPLNYDFHPKAVRGWLAAASFELQRQLTVSHFRIGILKRLVPTSLLVWIDSIASLTGDWWQLTPSVFTCSKAAGVPEKASPDAGMFSCPECKSPLGEPQENLLTCTCGLRWGIEDGIYNFKQPVK